MTFAQFHNPGDTLAAAIKAIILADSPAFPLAVFQHRQMAQMPTNHVEVMAHGFRRGSDQIGYSAAGVPFYNQLRGTVSFLIVTDRADQQQTDAHAYAKYRLDYLMSRPAQRLTPAALNGFEVLDIVRGADSPMSEDTATDTDRTILTYEMNMALPGSLYPTS